MIDITEWLNDAKQQAAASDCGMYLIHNGVVRGTAKAYAREGIESPPVKAMSFSYDKEKTDKAVAEAEAMQGIRLVRIWINEGLLSVGDDIMYVMVGGDTRTHVIDCLEKLVSKIKSDCVTESEIF